MAEWISVKDRLPDENGKYLCCCDSEYRKDKHISICFFAKNLSKVDKYDFIDGNRAGWYSYDSEWGYYEIPGVAHWMPLPELPKECDEK